MWTSGRYTSDCRSTVVEQDMYPYTYAPRSIEDCCRFPVSRRFVINVEVTPVRGRSPCPKGDPSVDIAVSTSPYYHDFFLQISPKETRGSEKRLFASMEETGSSSSPSHPAYAVHRLEGLPPEAFYIPNFVTEHEEQYLLRRVGTTLNTELDSSVGLNCAAGGFR